MAIPRDLTQMQNIAAQNPANHRNLYNLAEGYMKHYAAPDKSSNLKKPKDQKAFGRNNPVFLINAFKAYYAALKALIERPGPKNPKYELDYRGSFVGVLNQVRDKIAQRHAYHRRIQLETTRLPNFTSHDVVKGLTDKLFLQEFGLTLTDFKNLILEMQDFIMSMHDQDLSSSYRDFLRTFNLEDEIKVQKTNGHRQLHTEISDFDYG